MKIEFENIILRDTQKKNLLFTGRKKITVSFWKN